MTTPHGVVKTEMFVVHDNNYKKFDSALLQVYAFHGVVSCLKWVFHNRVTRAQYSKYFLTTLLHNIATQLEENNVFAATKGVATRSKNFNKIVSMTSHLQKTIVTIAFANDFIQSEHVELFRFVSLYSDWLSFEHLFAITFSDLRHIFSTDCYLFYYYFLSFR